MDDDDWQLTFACSGVTITRHRDRDRTRSICILLSVLLLSIAWTVRRGRSLGRLTQDRRYMSSYQNPNRLCQLEVGRLRGLWLAATIFLRGL